MPDRIYIDPSETNASVIQINGQCFERVGPSDHVPTVSSADYEFDTCEKCKRDIFTLVDCDGVEDDVVVDNPDWAQHVGKVFDVDGTCRTVTEGGNPNDVVDKSPGMPENSCVDCRNCGDCHFNESDTLDVDIFEYICQYGNTNCTGPVTANSATRYQGTLAVELLTAGSITWRGDLTKTVDTDNDTCPPSMGNASTENFRVRYLCFSGKWSYGETGSIPDQVDGGTYWDSDGCTGFSPTATPIECLVIGSVSQQRRSSGGVTVNG